MSSLSRLNAGDADDGNKSKKRSAPVKKKKKASRKIQDSLEFTPELPTGSSESDDDEDEEEYEEEEEESDEDEVEVIDFDEGDDSPSPPRKKAKPVTKVSPTKAKTKAKAKTTVIKIPRPGSKPSSSSSSSSASSMQDSQSTTRKTKEQEFLTLDHLGGSPMDKGTIAESTLSFTKGLRICIAKCDSIHFYPFSLSITISIYLYGFYRNYLIYRRHYTIPYYLSIHSSIYHFINHCYTIQILYYLYYLIYPSGDITRTLDVSLHITLTLTPMS